MYIAKLQVVIIALYPRNDYIINIMQILICSVCSVSSPAHLTQIDGLMELAVELISTS